MSRDIEISLTSENSTQPILDPPSSDFPLIHSQQRTQIRLKNRRKLYLERHPEYFNSPELELADPLLYDRYIRRFLSAAEREADGKRKGYSRVLEADLLRSEAKLAALNREPFRDDNSTNLFPSTSPPETADLRSSLASQSSGGISKVKVSSSTSDIDDAGGEFPQNREEGEHRWREVMEWRFLRGEDGEFDYEGLVDGNEEFDVLERREEEERWFDEQEPAWIEGDGCVECETGIQDF